MDFFLADVLGEFVRVLSLFNSCETLQNRNMKNLHLSVGQKS
jgi:hypothetical protein